MGEEREKRGRREGEEGEEREGEKIENRGRGRLLCASTKKEKSS
jgi:hypothetical protein